MGMIFQKMYDTRMYQGGNGREENGACNCFCLLKEAAPQETFLLKDIYGDKNLCPSFLFTAGETGIASEEEAEKWIAVLDEALAARGAGRALIWRETLEDGEHTNIVEITASGTSTAAQLVMPMCRDISMILENGTKISFDDRDGEERLVFGEGADTGLQIEKMKGIAGTALLSLPFTGQSGGCLRFYLDIRQTDFIQKFSPSFLFSYGGDLPGQFVIPLFYTKNGDRAAKFRFQALVFPGNLLSSSRERRTCFRFVKELDEGGVMHSWYQNVYGALIDFKPLAHKEEQGVEASEFVLANGRQEGKILVSPHGDFEICLPKGEREEFLCGIEGGERLEAVEPGRAGRWRFRWGMAGHAPVFPLQSLSVTGGSTGCASEYLTEETVTSWMTAAEGDLYYSSLPKGSFYYADTGGALLEPDFPNSILSPDSGIYFPMVPYAPDTEELSYLFERQMIMPVRRAQIQKSVGRAFFMKAMIRAALSGTGENGRWAVTPSGQWAYLEGQRLEKILLAKSRDETGKEYELSFEEPDKALTAAFFTSNLLLAGADGTHLSGFNNRIFIGDWKCRIDPGKGSKYGTYRNIVIVKGRKGALYDPDGESLFANPALWTRRDDFSSPVTEEGRPGDQSQQMIFSQWLMDYCRDTYGRGEGDAYFGEWNRLIADPLWQGVLFLNVDMTREDMPPGLACLFDGVKDAQRFCLHHIGYTVSPVDQACSDGTPFFGLIHYQDPGIKGGVTTVSPVEGTDYQFRLLLLNVKFRNSAVERFESYAQLTLNKIFGCSPLSDEYGCRDNTMLLEGVYQMKEGKSVFMLKNAGNARFCFTGGVLRYVDVKKASMEEGGSFDLEGCISFEELKEKEMPFDLYSFGGEKSGPSNGLEFSGLTVKKADGGESGGYEMSYGKLVFDFAKSRARTGSLYQAFSLNYLGFLVNCESSGQQSPTNAGQQTVLAGGGGYVQGRGYLPLSNSAGLSSFGGGNWFALRYGMSLGALGDLAGKEKIAGEILLGFEMGAGGKGCLGISLPGTGEDFLGLEGVLKVSYGSPKLILSEEGAFLLVLPDIGIKLLNVLSVPPANTTSFFLFGKEGSPLGWYAAYKKKTITD